LFTKNSSWQVKHSIPHITVTLYGDCYCEDFAPNFDDKELAVASQRFTASHFHFRYEICNPKQHDYRPHLPLFSLFLRLRIKVKGRHFDAVEVMEAESQAVLKPS
jgi:hypothetical protein